MPRNTPQGASKDVGGLNDVAPKGVGFSHATESGLHTALDNFRKYQRNNKADLLHQTEQEIRNLLQQAQDEGGAGAEKQVKLIQSCKAALEEAAKAQ